MKYNLYITETQSGRAAFSCVLEIKNGKSKIVKARRMVRRKNCYLGYWTKASIKTVSKELCL